jgi:hypothetical protein
MDRPFRGNPAAVCLLWEAARCAVDAGCGSGNKAFGNSIRSVVRMDGYYEQITDRAASCQKKAKGRFLVK